MTPESGNAENDLDREFERVLARIMTAANTEAAQLEGETFGKAAGTVDCGEWSAMV